MRRTLCCCGSSWLHAWVARTLVTSSTVKMARYTISSTSRSACLLVPGGSIGEDHAMVPQLTRMVRRMKGSKTGDSASKMASLRGSWYGRSTRKVLEW